VKVIANRRIWALVGRRSRNKVPVSSSLPVRKP
jgi:hypothetical protein